MLSQSCRGKYKIFLDKDNILHFCGEENPTEESARNILEEAAKFINEKQIKLVLVDLSAQDFKKLPPIRKEMYEAMSQTIGKLKLEKVAVIGTSAFLRVVCNFVFSHTKILTAKFFDTEKEALQWLHADN